MKYTDYKYSFKKSVRFRKWSRKAYGIFSSICYQVSIGHVCKWIADSALSKKNNIINTSSLYLDDIHGNLNENDDWWDNLFDICGINVSALNHIPYVLVPDYNSANLRFCMYNLTGDYKPKE